MGALSYSTFGTTARENPCDGSDLLCGSSERAGSGADRGHGGLNKRLHPMTSEIQQVLSEADYMLPKEVQQSDMACGTGAKSKVV
jgi:hypothetical protein